VTVKDDLITVITPIEGSPAWEAGLRRMTGSSRSTTWSSKILL